MTRRPQLWQLISRKLSSHQWTSLAELYSVVESSGVLDAEDQLPQGPRSIGPKWKRNVRNLLHHKKGTGEVEWNGSAGYRLVRPHT